MTPERLPPGDPRLPQVLDLIRRSFAFMEGRIDPPSSMHRLTMADIARQCVDGEVWVIGAPPLACLFLTPQVDSLYLGKLAVDVDARGTGLARRLIDVAEERARARALPTLELKVRVELTENQQAFARMGFCPVGHESHPGFDRPTSVTMRRAVGSAKS